MPSPRPLIIDTDPGIDDALAIALAIASSEVRVVALTSVAGNSPLDIATTNAAALLTAFDRGDIPIAAGAAHPLVGGYERVKDSPHGDNGLGGVMLEGMGPQRRSQSATDLIANVLRDAEPRSVDIAAIGPLTNIAIFLAQYPDLTDRIARITVMGGGTGPGNITDYAEFNIWHDPEAAAQVFSNAAVAEIVVVGLDVTRRATLDPDDLARLRRKSRRGALLARMIEAYGDIHEGGWPMHDALALASIVHPPVISKTPATIEVVTAPGERRGRTLVQFIDAGQPPASGPRIQFATNVDVALFRDLVQTRAAG
ncbi:nucleoside hydrolase [Rhodococcus sp. WAY2]|uniref:nucleoside hydrolase n=1 Tax=Rhodococcus sp. WAY2 TaxID=2663121 RepID=UPI00131FA34A|nr:nucleoside hydrolase [Rhodococcus sp. WAY2]QHE72895.1 Inosine-uridine preferring nucleoside hydrolase [Rhodococcus sp. WAY2]